MFHQRLVESHQLMDGSPLVMAVPSQIMGHADAQASQERMIDMKDYIPRKDMDLKFWLRQFSVTLEQHAAEFGVPADQVELMKQQCAAFGEDVDDYAQKRREAMAAYSNKFTTRRAATSTARFLAQWIGHHPAMTDSLRSDLGLRPKYIEDAATPVMNLAPGVHLESQNGVVVVHWGPNPMNERFNGKPKGVDTAAIYRKKTGESEFQLIGCVSRSPYRDMIQGPVAEYTYMVRYRGRKANELGQESPTVTIAARGALTKPAA